MSRHDKFVADLGHESSESWALQVLGISSTSPNDEEVKKAQRILSIFEEANTGLVMVDGKLIEKPVLRQMQRTVEISNKLKSS